MTVASNLFRPAFQFGLPASPQVYTKLLRMDVSSGPHGGLVLCLGLLLAPKNHQSRAALSRVRSRTRHIRTDFDVKLRSSRRSGPLPWAAPGPQKPPVPGRPE